MNKKRLTVFALFMSYILLLSACGSNSASETAQTSGNTQAQQASKTEEITEEPSSLQSETPTAEESGGHVLVAYFAYSENMGDTSGMDVDAITSASLNKRTSNTEGNLQVMAQEAANVKNGDLFSIQITDPYDPDYNTMVGIAQDDQKNGKQFTFVDEIENFDQYDTVFIGVPVWWGKLPQPMVSFFESYDFSGKTIIPFGIHLGSRFGSMINEMKELEPDATVLDGFTISADTDNEKVRTEFNTFLSGLN